MNLETLAATLHCQTHGPADYAIQDIGDIERLSIDERLKENYIYFIESPAVLKRHPKAGEGGAVLTTPSLAHHFSHALIAPEKDIRLALIKLLKHFDKTPTFASGISAQAHVHPSAKIAENAVVLPGATVMEGAIVGAHCTLYPGVVIEPFAEIGENSILYPCVVIGHHCQIGKNVIIHGGTVIGADGFGFYDQPGHRYKIPQIGNVIIDDEVEIGAGCTVDRATIESTRIGAYTKLDDQVHVGHNSQLGRFIYVVGNSAIGGSVTVGDGAMISGMVIIKDHLKIAPGSIIMGMSGVAQDTEPQTAYFGIPARPARQMHKMNAALEKLPELLAKVRDLEETLKSSLPEKALGSPI
jgi:UDP-3-O-[3-hydroxymyristoyl] glucosamine N-acyltransferase